MSSSASEYAILYGLGGARLVLDACLRSANVLAGPGDGVPQSPAEDKPELEKGSSYALKHDAAGLTHGSFDPASQTIATGVRVRVWTIVGEIPRTWNYLR